MADGVLLPGGGDLAARWSGQDHHETLYDVDEEQDAFDLALASVALEDDLPLLAVCRGNQVVNVLLGGDLVQDMGETVGDHRHRVHEIEVLDPALRTVLGDRCQVSCYHHQCLGRLGTGLVPAAVAEDGVVEAVVLPDRQAWYLGVQWHPEDLAATDPVQAGLFTAFVDACTPSPQWALASPINGRPRTDTSDERLRVHNLAMSLDGYVAGPDQGPENPLGVGGMALHDWVFATPTGAAMIGESGGLTGLDDDFLKRGTEGIGATIMGRNMFGPVRGEWPDDSWQGWWGDEPPYHHDVFVLTHHERAPLAMAGGTTFHFVTDGIHVSARAGDRGGGRAGHPARWRRVDRAAVPQRGARRRAAPGDRADPARQRRATVRGPGCVSETYEVVEVVPSPAVVHVRLARQAGDRRG